MVAAVPMFPVHAPSPDDEPRVLIPGVPWGAYVVLRDAIESPGVRMTYLEGSLEIMSPSKLHEVTKKQIARLLELFCLERDIPLFGYGSTTFRKEEQKRGLEPDECYCRGADREVPDLAIEVVVTAAALDKLEVYRGLGIGEVWVFESAAFRVLKLVKDHYEPVARSDVFPEVDLPELARFALEADQHAALQGYRRRLRTPE